MSEHQHEQRFRRWCERRGYQCLKLAIIGQRDFPDRTILIPGGRAMFVEMKADAKSLIRPGQVAWLKTLEQMGFPAARANSFEEAIQIVERTL